LENAASPFSIDKLLPDTTYDVYLVAQNEKGSSLRSTILNFVTEEPCVPP